MASTVTDELPHNNIQAKAVALIFAFPAAATLALALRVYSRALTRTFGSDDWVILFAGILYWADTFTSYEVIKYQYIGYHAWDVPADNDPAPGAKYGYATEIIYNPILALVKTSILLFLLRLTFQRSAVRWSLWGLLAFNNIMMVVTFLLTALHCVPVQSNWEPTAYPNAKCLNFADFVTGTACVAILTDVLVLAMPTWIVYNLQIPKKQKVMVIGILSFGFITVIAGIVRVIILDRYDRHLPSDPTYSLIFCLSTIEVGLSFIAACAPALKPIVARLAPKLLGMSSRSRSNNNMYGNGGTFRTSKLGYRLDDMSRRTANTTQIGAGEAEDEGSRGNSSQGAGQVTENKGIMLTRETNVTWNDDLVRGEKGTSVESLV